MKPVVDLTDQHTNRAVLVDGPDIMVRAVGVRSNSIEDARLLQPLRTPDHNESTASQTTHATARLRPSRRFSVGKKYTIRSG
ncbi:hypothetical protein ACQP1O_34090 [Nocardia sp. CA-151230]|uniref:hypothetical protein n=1 Tax=Nocardia sp. CA-151230 TaxID=3239982 RepID=UPI003D8D8D3C